MAEMPYHTLDQAGVFLYAYLEKKQYLICRSHKTHYITQNIDFPPSISLDVYSRQVQDEVGVWEGVGLPWGWQGFGGVCCASLVAGSPSSDGRSCTAIGSFGGATSAERKVHCCFKMGWLDLFKGMDDNMTKHLKLFGCESNKFCTAHIFV